MIKNTNLKKKPDVTSGKSASYERYEAVELRPFDGRAKAMDAFDLPSVRLGKRVKREMYMPREESK